MLALNFAEVGAFYDIVDRDLAGGSIHSGE